MIASIEITQAYAAIYDMRAPARYACRSSKGAAVGIARRQFLVHISDMQNSSAFHSLCQRIFDTMSPLVPKYLESPSDLSVSQGNVCCVIMDHSGKAESRCWGNSNQLQRTTAMIAWQKALQVRLTDIPTGDFERMVFNGEKNWWEFGIQPPDLIGWQGGIPFRTPDGSMVAIAFSGFNGHRDCALIREVAGSVGGLVETFLEPT